MPSCATSEPPAYPPFLSLGPGVLRVLGQLTAGTGATAVGLTL